VFAASRSWLDAWSTARHETMVLIRDNENAWTELAAKPRSTRFPASRYVALAQAAADRHAARPDVADQGPRDGPRTWDGPGTKYQGPRTKL